MSLSNFTLQFSKYGWNAVCNGVPDGVTVSALVLLSINVLFAIPFVLFVPIDNTVSSHNPLKNASDIVLVLVAVFTPSDAVNVTSNDPTSAAFVLGVIVNTLSA